MLEWNDLRYFLAIYRAKTLAGAARSLGVEHTTAGRRLAAMERDLGAKLFVRTPDGFTPTESAMQILPLAEQAESAVRAIERVTLGEDERIEGVVRLATSEGSTSFLGPHLAELRRRHPGITLEVLVSNATLDLTRREADIALRSARTPQSELLCQKVASIGWSAYATRGYVEARGTPTPITTLAGHSVIGFDEHLNNPAARWLATHSEGANIVLRTASLPAALHAALGGIGIAVIPCFLAEREQTLVRLTPEVVGCADIFMVVHPDLARVARVRAVMDFFTECLATNSDTLSGTRV
ncbi:MAG TPA: LysR family transcriptional regulator [Polyangiaceae bacterium]|jgi:DNA-binding transcriptional LysR family regulator|nr:LysR family transcriptional regulator [Polyangiaceae bacterium]